MPEKSVFMIIRLRQIPRKCYLLRGAINWKVVTQYTNKTRVYRVLSNPQMVSY